MKHALFEKKIIQKRLLLTNLPNFFSKTLQETNSFFRLKGQLSYSRLKISEKEHPYQNHYIVDKDCLKRGATSTQALQCGQRMTKKGVSF